DREPIQVWTARGDPMRAGAPFAIVGDMVRQQAGIADGEPAPARRERIAARVARSVEATSRARVAEFRGELVGAPFPDEDSVQLRAARRDPMLMGDQLRRAWVDLVDAECQRMPLVLVLEDLHWGDQPSVEHVDAALRLLADRPLMV